MRARRQEPEYLSQCEVVAWARHNQRKYPALRLLYAVPNSGKFPVQYRVKLAKQGLLPGINDLVIPCPGRGFNAMYLEMKAPKGELSDTQKEIHPILREYNNYVVTCYSAESAIQEIIAYLTQPPVVHA